MEKIVSGPRDVSQIARPDRPTEVVRQDRQREREKKTGKRGGGKSKEKASISIHWMISSAPYTPIGIIHTKHDDWIIK